MYFSAVGTASAIASVKVARKGRVRCISFSSVGIAGAATDCAMVVEISKQSSSAIGINDSPETVLARFAHGYGVASAASTSQIAYICDIPVDVGDTFYAHSYRSGTIPTTNLTNVTLYTD